MARRRALRAAAAGVLLLAAAGCDRPVAGVPTVPTAATRPPTTPAGPTGGQRPPTGMPTVTVNRTGGVGGVDQRLVVRPDGGWTWVPGRAGGGSGTSGRLDDRTRAELARLTADPDLPAEGARHRGPEQCADAFHYTVAVRAAVVSWYWCGDPPPVAGAIVALLAAATPL